MYPLTIWGASSNVDSYPPAQWQWLLWGWISQKFPLFSFGFSVRINQEGFTHRVKTQKCSKIANIFWFWDIKSKSKWSNRSLWMVLYSWGHHYLCNLKACLRRWPVLGTWQARNMETWYTILLSIFPFLFVTKSYCNSQPVISRGRSMWEYSVLLLGSPPCISYILPKKYKE